MDADAARSAIMKGHSTTPGFRPALCALALLRRTFPTRLSDVRVPGVDNIGDLASRRSDTSSVPSFLCPSHDGDVNCRQCIDAALSHPDLKKSLALLVKEAQGFSWWNESFSFPHAVSTPIRLPETDELPAKCPRRPPMRDVLGHKALAAVLDSAIPSQLGPASV